MIISCLQACDFYYVHVVRHMIHLLVHVLTIYFTSIYDITERRYQA